MRIRYIKPSFFDDEDIAGLPFWVRILYAGLWCLADKAGRLEDKPKWIKVKILPYDDDIKIEDGLTLLASPKRSSTVGSPFINRYEAGGQKYIEILRWHDHQKPHGTEAESKIPAPMGKGMGKGEGNGEAGIEPPLLFNGDLTVKEPLKQEDGEETTPKIPRSKAFIPPTRPEVEAYSKEIGYSLDPDKFINAYEQKGWMVGKSKMKCWKAAIRNWKTNGWGKNDNPENKHAGGFNTRQKVRA